MTIEKVNDAFRRNFGTGGNLYASPGRVNLIGEHTDYNLGFVLPGAIRQAIYARLKPNGGTLCRIYSVDYDENVEFDVAASELPVQQWARYVYGVVHEVRKLGKSVAGFDCAFGGDVPLGAGLSSSAAFESVIGYGLNDLFGLGLSRLQLAKAGQMTEHNYIGVRCGIMDQFASLFGEKDRLIRLDCRSLEYRLEPFRPEGYRVLLLDTQVKHSLASSQYNVRREQCEAGVTIIRRHVPEVESLRDVTPEMLETYRGKMEDAVYRRCHYIVGENGRLLKACEALERGDYETFGRQMFGSHEGLSREYKVSCADHDFLAGEAAKHSGVLGARMMGGGFGGCTINLVREAEYENLVGELSEKYAARFGKAPRVIDVVIGDGARRVE